MRTLSTELQEHLNGEVTTLCRCWIVEKESGEHLGFTDHDQNLTLNGVICEGDSGMETSEIEEQLGMNVNTAEVAGALRSSLVSEKAIEAGEFDNARVTTYIVNWNDTSQHVLDRASVVGQIVREDGAYRMELRGLTSTLDQTVGRYFVKRCQADLGDGQCKVDLENSGYSAQGNVASAKSRNEILVTGLQAYEAGWFTAGQLAWSDGLNAGRQIEVLDHRIENGLATLHLWQPMPDDISSGDGFDISAGCDKSFDTCKSKFSNFLNFRGFPHVPGNSYVLTYVGNSENFDGGPIIP